MSETTGNHRSTVCPNEQERRQPFGDQVDASEKRSIEGRYDPELAQSK